MSLGRAGGPIPRCIGVALLVLIASAGVEAAQKPPGTPNGTASSRCNEAANTLEIVACQSRQLTALNNQLRLYLEAARRREQQLAREDRRTPSPLQQGQKAWEAYRTAACTEVYLHWGSGSIRGPLTMACQLDLTRERLRRVWSDFLTFPDGSPPLLPEPR